MWSSTTLFSRPWAMQLQNITCDERPRLARRKLPCPTAFSGFLIYVSPCCSNCALYHRHLTAFAFLTEIPTRLSFTPRKARHPLIPFSPSAGSRHRRKTAISASQNGSVPRKPPPLRIAYQGAPGAYSELAAKTACPDCAPLPCKGFVDVVAAVEAGHADCAVIPVESTLEGTAVRSHDLLLRRDLQIVQEISLFVQYCLLAMPGVRRGELKKAISHPVALAHCGHTLAQLGLNHEAVDDTAGAVELLLSQKLLDTAAIARSRAALMYGLNVLAHGLQDESWNVTRFLILSKESLAPTSACPAPFGRKTKKGRKYFEGCTNDIK